MGATAHQRRLARSLSSRVHGRGADGVGKYVLQVCGREQSNQHPQSRWEQQGEDALVNVLSPGGCQDHYDPASEQKISNRNGVRSCG